jgi:hypothetical protein
VDQELSLNLNHDDYKMLGQTASRLYSFLVLPRIEERKAQDETTRELIREHLRDSVNRFSSDDLMYISTVLDKPIKSTNFVLGNGDEKPWLEDALVIVRELEPVWRFLFHQINKRPGTMALLYENETVDLILNLGRDNHFQE